MYYPIYPDKNVKSRDYDFLKKDELLVTSIFYTLQGEGPYAGQRAVFIRLSGCNYGSKGIDGRGCTFCDAKFNFDEGKVKSFEDIYQEIVLVRGKVPELIVITGGEPFLQDNLRSFLLFLLEQNENVKIQIESNGFEPAYEIPRLVTIVVSPKIPESMELGHRGKYANMSTEWLQRVDFLKVLVSKDRTSPYNKLPEYLDFFHHTLGKTVYLSPVNVYKRPPNTLSEGIWNTEVFDHEQCAANHKYAAKLCMEKGYILSVQQHVYCGVE